MTPLRIVFFGTPAFAVPTLRALLASSHEVVAVVTQPDRPRGRGQQVRPQAVKIAAEAAALPVLQPERLADPSFVASFEALDADLGVVAAYGKLLPETMLATPRLGMVNVHASLLPRWRGAAPVHRAILAGDAETGVTIMRIVKALDAGPMLASVTTTIDSDETSADLEARLANLGGALLVETVDRLAATTIAEVPQDDRRATYAPRLEKRESAIDWDRPAEAIHNQIRGLHPWPLAAATFLGRQTQLLRSRIGTANDATAKPGTVSAVLADAIAIAAAPGVIEVLALQVAGKPPTSVRAFLQGHRVALGEPFEPLSGGPG